MSTTTDNKKCYGTQLYHTRLLLNRCGGCGRQDAFTMSGRARCADCAEVQRRASKKIREATSEELKRKKAEHYKTLKEEHRCVKCGKALSPAWDKVICQRCNAKAKQRYLSNRVIRPGHEPHALFSELHPDICTRCRKRPRYQHHKLCEFCYQDQLAIAKKGTQAYKEKYERRNNGI